MSQEIWFPPLVNIVKINTDASWNETSMKEDLGWVICDSKGWDRLSCWKLKWCYKGSKSVIFCLEVFAMFVSNKMRSKLCSYLTFFKFLFKYISVLWQQNTIGPKAHLHFRRWHGDCAPPRHAQNSTNANCQ